MQALHIIAFPYFFSTNNTIKIMQQTNASQPWTSHLDLFGNPECDYHAQVTIGSTLVNMIIY